MNKKLMILIGALCATVLAVGVATSGAWFSDSERVTVQASSGQLDIQLLVRGPDAAVCDEELGVADGDTPVNWIVTDLLPGESESRCINLYNTAVSPTVKFRYRTGDITGPLTGALTLKAQRGDCVTPTPGIANLQTVFEGPLGSFNGTDLDGAGTEIGPDGSWGTVDTNITKCFLFTVTMDPNAGNEYQGTSGSFNIWGDATQTDNPGW
jgi:hypothetical protein